MKLLGKCLGLIVGSVVASTAYAAVDGSEAVICAAVEIMECVPDEECQHVSARDAGIPRFLQIDFAGQQITRTKPGGDEIASHIERSEVVDGRLHPVLVSFDCEPSPRACRLTGALIFSLRLLR